MKIAQGAIDHDLPAVKFTIKNPCGLECPIAVPTFLLRWRCSHLVDQSTNICRVSLKHRCTVSYIDQRLLGVVIAMLIGQPEIGLLEKSLVARCDTRWIGNSI